MGTVPAPPLQHPWPRRECRLQQVVISFPENVRLPVKRSRGAFTLAARGEVAEIVVNVDADANTSILARSNGLF